VKSRLTIIVSGMVAGDHGQGGAAWAVLQYVLGFARLGHDVYLVEPLGQRSLKPVDTSLAATQNADYFNAVARDFGLFGKAALLLSGTRETAGLPYDQLQQVARRADLLINISGMLSDPALLEPIARRVYLDLDPAFNQLWHAVQGIDMRFDGHTHFVTIGSALGTPRCAVPTCGRHWHKTRPPVVLARWPVAEDLAHDALTTVGNWRGYGSIEHDGICYGQKAHSLRRFFDLPQLTRERFLLALSIHPQETRDWEALHRYGWQIVDPAKVAGSPGDYQRFIQGSRAEFGLAKSGYVLSRCGWFSDRSVCYLASGRPVIAQDTGFSGELPVGEGLFAFQTADDLCAAVEALRADYTRHARKARELAETCFDSNVVLRQLLETLGA
jgi:hypothetical protein